ncbi:MAG TPA: LLM class flavin-dependent oxidoreductase [Candidatus Dormibacteraeota bacterium]|nr:LLM class flavin-dependent oxidoreductase [Candidatus Dormibacteraeota bacterium]
MAPTRGITLMGGDVRSIADLAARAEAAGFDSAWTAEFYDRSGTISLAAMAMATTRVRLGSGILYALGRSPLMLATEARDLYQLTNGRLVLGLGTGTPGQAAAWLGVDPNHLAPRIEELIPLLRRLLRLDLGPVRHKGPFYQVDVIPLTEVPPPVSDHLPIYLAAVNKRMAEAAGRVADGLVGHPMFSPEYVRDVIRPALARNRRSVPISGYVLCSVAERTGEARAAAAAQIAFYAVVKTFDAILEHHGFREEASAIREAWKRRDMAGAAASVSNRMLEAFAVYGTPEEARQRLRQRFDGVYEETLLFPPSVAYTGRRQFEAALRTIDAMAAVRA